LRWLTTPVVEGSVVVQEVKKRKGNDGLQRLDRRL
jgi:hypothetical protein